MNKKLLWAGVLGLAGVALRLVSSSMPVAMHAENWQSVGRLVRSALLIAAYSLMSMSGVKCAHWIYAILGLIGLSVVFSVERLLGHSLLSGSHSWIWSLVNSGVGLSVWIVLACRNAGRLRTFFVAWSAKSMLELVLAIVFYAYTASQGAVPHASWPLTVSRAVGFLSLLITYCFWLYLIYAAQPEEVRPASEPLYIAWPWRVFLVTLPVVSAFGLGMVWTLPLMLIAPIGMTFGVGGPLLGGIVGWGAYLALGILILRTRRLSTILSILGALVFLVILNIAGCGVMFGG